MQTINYLNTLHFDVALIGVNAVDEKHNFYTTDEEEAAVKQAVIENTYLSFGLADRSKWG